MESGTLHSSNRYRLVRNKDVLKLNLRLNSIKQDKNSVHIVREDEECGIVFEDPVDFEPGDFIDSYEVNPKYEGITNTKSVAVCY